MTNISSTTASTAFKGQLAAFLGMINIVREEYLYIRGDLDSIGIVSEPVLNF